MKNNFQVLSSSSKGNAILYRDRVMVDCGIPIKKLPDDIDMILLTHIHADHLNIKTLLSLQGKVKVFSPAWLYDMLIENGIENVVKIEINKVYSYKGIKFSAFHLYHNVENCGYRIIDKEYKIFHATDTAHLNGIVAKNYDLYAIEHNYDANTIEDIIDDKLKRHVYCYELYAVENHMSFQIARKWLEENKSNKSQIEMLHISSRYYNKGVLELPKELI